MTELEKIQEAEKEALRRENKRLNEENRQLRELVRLQLKNKPLLNRGVELSPMHACM